MANGRNRNVQAGGFVLAAAILTGALSGVVLGQPSLGFLIGTGLGIFATLLIWLRTRAIHDRNLPIDM